MSILMRVCYKHIELTFQYSLARFFLCMHMQVRKFSQSIILFQLQ